MNKMSWTILGMVFAMIFIALDLTHFAIAIGIGILLLWFLNDEDWKQIDSAKGNVPDAGELTTVLFRAPAKKVAEVMFAHPAERYTTKDLGLRVSKGSRRLIESANKITKGK